MMIYQVFFGFKNAQGRPVYWTIEHPAPTIEALGAELGERGFIIAARLWTESDGSGSRKITARDSVIIGLTDLGAIQVAGVKHWEQG